LAAAAAASSCEVRAAAARGFWRLRYCACCWARAMVMWVCSSGLFISWAWVRSLLVVKGLVTPLPRENEELERFILKAEFLVEGVLETGEGTLVCLFSTVLTVTVVPAGIFLVNDSVFLTDS